MQEVPMNTGTGRKTGDRIPIYNARTGNVDQVTPVIRTDAEWQALLTPEQVQKLEAIGQWTPPPGGPERAGPRPPSGPGGPPAPQP